MKKTSKRIIVLFMAFILACTGMIPVGKTAEAAETATVRIISTTDLHGQLANVNYDTAGERSVGSLAQAYTLIKEARSEVKYGTSITVDVGDTVYGFGSEQVTDNEDESQYMYSVMSKMGYDAMTLGNHDFDFGYDYIKDQLDKAGLTDKLVLSNVYDAVTGETVWTPSKLLTKDVKTSKGKTIQVKVGVIGVTRPGLTNYYNHKGILTTTDIVESTKEQVKNLQAQGSDIIVVLSHSGMGAENPEPMAGDASYAISKIDGVDAVMFGHTHLNFPSGEPKVQNYYKLPNVNRATGLVNGKPVVMVADRGQSVGIADLKLEVSNGKVKIVGAKSNIKYAKKDTESEASIVKYQEAYNKEMKKMYSEVVGELEEGKEVTNYFGLLEDNISIQLVNEAKIQLGLEYINSKDKEYKDYPVISVSNYKKYGQESKDDYVNVSGKITMKDVLSIQSYYHDYAYVYWITGKQLKEWLEWTASAYSLSNSKAKTSDAVMDGYISQMGMSSLIKKDWLSDWSSFWIFDGIEYKIDITQQPKYSLKGSIINQGSERISSLTYNGERINDDTKMILVSDIITQSKTVVGAAVANQRIYKGKEFSANLLKNYIKNLSEFGKIEVEADDNWRISMPSSENYLIRSSANSEDVAKQESWYQETLQITDEYAYYKASFQKDSFKDTKGPTLVLAPTITVKTNKDIPIIIQATDQSGVKSLQYTQGQYAIDDPIWQRVGSNNVYKNQFDATVNGVYSVLAIDGQGNKSIKYVNISNINRDVLQIPEVNRVTNKSSSVSGIGEPEVTVNVKIGKKEYTAKTDAAGNFTCKIPYPKAGEIILVNQQFGESKKSDDVEVEVLRAGPNYPDITNITNKDGVITADMKDKNSQIFAIINDTVYVSKNGGKKMYETSTQYDKRYEIIETDLSRADETVSLTIPVQYAGTKIKVFPVDHIGRLNYGKNFTVEEVGPEMPVLYTACDGERYVYGYVPLSKNQEYPIKVTVGSNVYTGVTNLEGYFKIETDNLLSGQIIYANASDEVEGVARESANGNRAVVSYDRYLTSDSTEAVSIDPITDRDTVVRGSVTNFNGTLFLKIGDTCYDISMADTSLFEITLETPLAAGQNIIAVLRKDYSNIRRTAGVTVQLTVPDKPTLLNSDIYTTTQTIKIESKDKATASVKVGSKVYQSKNGTYNESTGVYTYEVKIEKSKAGKTVYVYMENDAGKSGRIVKIVEEKEPKKDTKKETDSKKK